MSFEPILQRKLLDYVFGGVDPALGATVYLAVCTNSTYAVGDTLTEPWDAPVSDTSYARIAITRNQTNFPAATTDGDYLTSIKLALAQSFTAATKNWGAIRYMALFDASTAGNALIVFAVNPQTTIVTGVSFTISANKLVSMYD
jgi:hypothetical protein